MCFHFSSKWYQSAEERQMHSTHTNSQKCCLWSSYSVYMSFNIGCSFSSLSWVNFVWLLLFLWLFHLCITAVTHKRPQSFCQKLRWQYSNTCITLSQCELIIHPCIKKLAACKNKGYAMVYKSCPFPEMEDGLGINQWFKWGVPAMKWKIVYGINQFYIKNKNFELISVFKELFLPWNGRLSKGLINVLKEVPLPRNGRWSKD